MSISQQKQKEITLIRLLIYTLSLHPDEFGLLPNNEGWISIKELIKAFHEDSNLRYLRKSIIIEVAQRLAPMSLELAKGKIRARDRRFHCPQSDMLPPTYLYFAARRRSYFVILKQGLTTQKGSSLLLSNNPIIANRLGQRYDAKPILITVSTQQAIAHGIAFTKWGEQFWLCNHVPIDCLITATIKEEKLLKTYCLQKQLLSHSSNYTDSPYSALAMPGSFFLTAKNKNNSHNNKLDKKSFLKKKQYKRKS